MAEYDGKKGISSDEVAIPICDGKQLLVFPDYTRNKKGVDYVRFVDKATERELLYYTLDEWRDEPESVMGAIMAAIQNGADLVELSADELPEQEDKICGEDPAAERMDRLKNCQMLPFEGPGGSPLMMPRNAPRATKLADITVVDSQGKRRRAVCKNVSITVVQGHPTTVGDASVVEPPICVVIHGVVLHAETEEVNVRLDSELP